MNAFLTLLLLFLIFLTYRIIQWRQRLSRIRKTLPAIPVLYQVGSVGRIFFPVRWQKWHNDWQFQNRHKFDDLGCNITPFVSLFGLDSFYISNPDAIIEIATSTTRFVKAIELYGVLDIYGKNVVTTEGTDWRTHRKITARPFSEKNNQLVHEESVRQSIQMMADWESKSPTPNTVIVEKPVMETMKFALHVITGAGFGVPINWDTSSDTVEAPHTLSFKNAVTTVLHHLFPIMLVPRRLWKLPFDTMRRASEGYYEFGNYMRELLEREKALGKESDGQNLMAALVKHSSEGEAGSNALLSDQEIIGNTFIFLLAGHETTAHTLLYAFFMLAIHPDIQDKLYSEIRQTIGDKVPTYDDFPNLVYPLCIMFETLRMFPPVVGIPKKANGDQLLLGKYLIPNGTYTFFDTVNLHHNKHAWGSDIHTFNPSRFDGRNLTQPLTEKDTGDTSPGATYEKIKMPAKGAFAPFSEGARSCLGRKFAQVEFVACLVMVMRSWSVELAEGWSTERVWEVINKSITIITLVPTEDIPLVFKKRPVN